MKVAPIKVIGPNFVSSMPARIEVLFIAVYEVLRIAVIAGKKIPVLVF